MAALVSQSNTGQKSVLPTKQQWQSSMLPIEQHWLPTKQQWQSSMLPREQQWLRGRPASLTMPPHVALGNQQSHTAAAAHAERCCHAATSHSTSGTTEAPKQSDGLVRIGCSGHQQPKHNRNHHSCGVPIQCAGSGIGIATPSSPIAMTKVPNTKRAKSGSCGSM